MAPVRHIRVAAALVVCDYYHNRKKRNRKCWVREWILRRDTHEAHNNLLKELKIEDSQQFRNFIRMSATGFEGLLAKWVQKFKSFTWDFFPVYLTMTWEKNNNQHCDFRVGTAFILLSWSDLQLASSAGR
ncbi:hypothetical protein J437_LFUL018777 [Ladona fulva]|nr:hypothetical protein J437_LFUL018777 [Ladona fulva]